MAIEFMTSFTILLPIFLHSCTGRAQGICQPYEMGDLWQSIFTAQNVTAAMG
jgi:hypothetical protein